MTYDRILRVPSYLTFDDTSCGMAHRVELFHSNAVVYFMDVGIALYLGDDF